MWNNNIGNVKYIPVAGDDNWEYMMLANVWEVINGQRVTFQPPSPATWFRAFPTLADGVAFQMDFLKNHRYANAWSAVESGNPAAFAHLLKLAGYYTAPEADYVRLMNYYFAKYMNDFTYETVVAAMVSPQQPPGPPPTGPVPTTGGISNVWNVFSPMMRVFKKNQPTQK
jgi:flagellar protein FlgJ